MDTLCGLFGKRRQWYYEKSKFVVPEKQRRQLLIEMIDYYRSLCPRIGGVKLYNILSEEFGKEITHGRDAFYKLYIDAGFSLPPNKPRHTTDSKHIYKKYPNLIQGLDIQYVNQVWVSDITYVWILGDVLYLHLVTDAFSHAVIGWCLSDSLEAKHTLVALKMAIVTAGGGNLCGTIHHSDRGSQYACNEYVAMLLEHHIRISMTERYNPTDNPIAERQNGIFKTEWIYHQNMYRDYDEAHYKISQMIEFYNFKRPHMSIGNMYPMNVYLGEEPGTNLWRKCKKIYTCKK